MQRIKQDKTIIILDIFLILYTFFLFTNDVIRTYSMAAQIVFAIISLTYVVMDLFNKKSCLKSYRIDTLMLFTIVNIISIFINFKYGFSDNIFSTFTLFVNYLVIYSLGAKENELQVQHLFKAATHFILFLYTAAVVFSLFMFCFTVSHEFYINETRVLQGFVESRLFGIFSDPNYASMVCLVLAMICVYYMLKTKDRFYKHLYGTGAFLHMCYVILSGSRTAILAFVASFLVGSYFVAFRKIKHKQWSRLKRQGVCILAAIVFTSASYGGIEMLKIGLTYVPMAVSYVAENETKDTKPISLVREDVEQSEDYSNNRLDIWESAFTIFKQKPLFGTSPRNLVAYAQSAFPAGYIATTGYAIHNGVYETMVFSGLLGIGLLLLFIFSCAYHTFKHLYTKTEDHFEEVLLGTMIIIAMMVSAMTLSMLFYNRGTYNTLFWLAMGFLTYYVCPKKNDGVTLKICNRLFNKERK